MGWVDVKLGEMKPEEHEQVVVAEESEDEEPHTPARQLQAEDALREGGKRQTPVPDVPSEHLPEEHLDEHAVSISPDGCLDQYEHNYAKRPTVPFKTKQVPYLREQLGP